jgi:two-component system, chemotaxis family, sensor kinase CheA
LASIEMDGKECSLTFEDLTRRLGVSAEMKLELDQPVEPCLGEASVSRPEPKGCENSTAPLEGRQPVEAASVGDSKVPKERSDGVDGKKQVPWDGVERRKLSAPVVEDAEPSSAAADANIRVAVDLLDKLMDLVGELALVRNQILQLSTAGEDPALNATSQRLNLITTELQESVMKMRMQPIGAVWNKLPRVVRDLAIVLGKGVQLIMEGAETELDRTIIEAIKDPLMHLVRNSCDHGIQSPQVRMAAGKPAQGFLTLRAYHKDGQLNIEVADDGAGIDVVQVKQKAVESGLLSAEHADNLSDREALALIFEPGFSMAKTVTNISGRGVGMDVVKSHVEKIGGVVDVFSRLGEGTTIKIRIPLDTKAASTGVEQDGSPVAGFRREVQLLN